MEVFDRTHHKALWEYMAQEKTLIDIIAKSVDNLNPNYVEFEFVYACVLDSVGDKKMEFFVQNHILYDDIPINCCYACQTSYSADDFIQNCDKCPVNLKGKCEESTSKSVTKGNLYDRYIKYIAHIVINSKEKDKYMKQAQKMALQIANAKLQYEVEEI